MDQVEQPNKSDERLGDRCHALLLLSSLFHTLSHKIRTPLSVISNELACVDPALAEVSRSRRRCLEIVDILDSVPAAALSSPSFEDVPFAELDIRTSTAQTILIRADRKLLPLAFQLFEALCAELFRAKPAFATMIQIDPDSNNSSLLLRVAINHAPYRPASRRYRSLTDYLCNTLNLDVPTAPFIDAILWAHGVQIEIVASSSTTFSFTLPAIS